MTYSNCILITESWADLVLLAQVKGHSKIDDEYADDDVLLKAQAAQEYVEDCTGRALLTSEWRVYVSEFPIEKYIEIPKGQLQSVAHVKYYGADETEYTFSTDYYAVNTATEPGRIELKYQQSWPTTTLRETNPIEIRFTAGWQVSTDVPPKLRSAVNLLFGHLMENREAVVLGNSSAVQSAALELGVARLLDNSRVRMTQGWD